MFKDMRARFIKTSDAVYFSHLDLQRAMQRALRRSKIPYWSTGGFSPHPYCIFAQPLSLGFESQGELFDFRITDEATFDPNALKNAFPESLKILEVYEPHESFKKITDAIYEISLITEADPTALKDAFHQPLMILKKTKRSEKEVDIRDFLGEPEIIRHEKGVLITCKVATGNDKTLNPNYIIAALERAGFPCESEKITRICFLNENGEVFR